MAGRELVLHHHPTLCIVRAANHCLLLGASACGAIVVIFTRISHPLERKTVWRIILCAERSMHVARAISMPLHLSLVMNCVHTLFVRV